MIWSFCPHRRRASCLGTVGEGRTTLSSLFGASLSGWRKCFGCSLLLGVPSVSRTEQVTEVFVLWRGHVALFKSSIHSAKLVTINLPQRYQGRCIGSCDTFLAVKYVRCKLSEQCRNRAIAPWNRRASRPNVPARVRRQGCSPLPPLDSTLTAPASPKRGGA